MGVLIGAPTSDRFPAIGARLTAGGAVAQLFGLAIDGWLHMRDPNLAGSETVFSLGNVGHSLLLTGITLVCAGVTLQWATSHPPSPMASGAGRILRGAAMAGGALLLSGTTAATANMMAGDGHGQGESGHTGPAHSAAPNGSDLHDHHRSIPPLDEAARVLLDHQLGAARDVALRYPHPGDAVAAGFVLAASYEPMIGSHYLRYSDVDSTFDVTRPEMLLYDGDAPDSRIVGLSYYVIGSVPPEGFAGMADDWHQHRDTCLTVHGPVFAGDGYRQCRASGRHSWMLHAWVVPGWESPQGVFSTENARLR